MFDWEQYLQNYPDLTSAGIDTYQKAFDHFVNHGKKEGRTCTPLNFDWEQYLVNYPDLVLASVNTREKVLKHYIDHGKSEKRIDKLYISLGSNCSTSFILNKIHKNIFNNNLTNLFDYIITTSYPYKPDNEIKDIVQLSLKNINEILKDNYIFDVNDLIICRDDKWINHFKKIFNIERTHEIVFHKDFISIHDQQLGNNDLTELNNKLNRRLQRFINIIKKNKTITFIRYEMNNFDLNDYIEFKNNINRINKSLKIKIYIISHKNYTYKHNLAYLKIFTLNDYKVKNKSDRLWMWSDFDWKLFFKYN